MQAGSFIGKSNMFYRYMVLPILADNVRFYDALVFYPTTFGIGLL